MPLNPNQINDLNDAFGLTSSSVQASNADELNEMFGLTSSTAALNDQSVGELNDLFGIQAADESGDDPEIDAESFSDDEPALAFLASDTDEDSTQPSSLATAADALDTDPSVLTDLLDSSDEQTAHLAGAESYLAADGDFGPVPVEIDRGVSVLTDLHKLAGKTVVLTGKPPQTMTKRDVAQMLTHAFKVKAIDSAFTNRTQVVVYSRLQTDTSKLKKAFAAGLTVIPYDNLIDAVQAG